VFLHLTGRIPSPLPHRQNPKRPTWEVEALRDCAIRLKMEVASSSRRVEELTASH
jgi:hypothetical protein